MHKFALMASLLGIACLSGIAAYSQATFTLTKAASKNGRAIFNIVVGGAAIGTCYELDCAAEVRRLAKSLPTEAELNAAPEVVETEEKPKEKKAPGVSKDKR